MKHVKFLIIIGFLVLGAYYGRLAYTNLRGARPAFGPPAGNIVTEMEKSAVNTTGFPLSLPAGFSISIFAKSLSGPRVLAFDPNGTLLVSIPSRGQIVALPDENHDGVVDETKVILDHLNQPHGLAFHPETHKLYIAETNQVAVYDYDESTQKASNKHKIIDLPSGGNHVTRTIGFGPSKNLYIAVGSSCNVCIEDDARRAKILVMSDKGTMDYATGLRNSVFFTWHPKTMEIWATEMGRDLIGDDIPPDEVNIVKYGSFYGWPYCYGKNMQDKTFTDDKGLNLFGFQGLTLTEVCQRATPSHIDIPAHSAPLGLAFIPSQTNALSEKNDVNKFPTGGKLTTFKFWPKEYQGNLLVAYHGSWNRSEPTGYKVVRMKLDEQGNYAGTEDFITGWLTPAGGEDGALGRPVDLLFGPDGSLYISDDKSGVIYRVSLLANP